MWISSITCGVKRALWPSTWVLRPSFFFAAGIASGTFFSFAMSCLPLRADLTWQRGMSGCRAVSEDQFLLGGLEIVVVPQLPAGGDLLEVLHALGSCKPVHFQLALEPLRFEVGHLRGHRIHSQPGDLAADVDGAVVHGVAEIL